MNTNPKEIHTNGKKHATNFEKRIKITTPIIGTKRIHIEDREKRKKDEHIFIWNSYIG